MKNFIILTAFCALMVGCASTQPTFNSQDCTTANWQEIGIQDGKQGQNSQRIQAYQKHCPIINTDAHGAWEAGRQIGLKSYCTKSHAYELGRRGYTLSSVCEGNLAELHQANMMGLEQYEIYQRIHRPYDHGYYGVPLLLPWYFY